MTQSLQRIKQTMISLGLSVMLVVGDQQTYMRMVALKRAQPEEYSWLVPMPGEFHFRVHVDFALNELCWESLHRNLVAHLGFEKTIQEKEGDVERADHHDVFSQLVTKAAVAFFEELAPAHLLSNYPMMLAAISKNKGASLLF
jgi:hypothetical protein